MASPTLKVEIAFVSDPLDTTPTWTDVSIYVRRSPGLVISRGRQSELDQFSAGYCKLTLSNRDRRFDPSHAAGPNFGNLLPGKPIRITATWSAVDYTMFTGWVTGWPQDFLSPHGRDATVTIEAFDALAWLATSDLPPDLVYTYANDTIGSLAMFLRNVDTRQWSDATNNGRHASLFSGRGTTSGSLAKGTSSPSVVFDGSTTWAANYAATGAWSLSFWLQTTTTAVPSIAALGGGSGIAVGAIYTALVISDDGDVLFYWGGGAVGTNAVVGGGAVNDGVPHHVVITGDGAAAANSKIYVDGVDKTGSTSPAGGTHSIVIDVIGEEIRGNNSEQFVGSLQDIAAFTKQLSAAEVLAFYNRTYGYLEESSAARVTRLLDDVGWPASWRSITTTSRATVGELVYNAAPVLGKLQEIQRSEQGRIFATKANFVAFLERYYVQEQTAGNTVQQIFSDDGGATALPYSTFGFEYVDLDVTNQVTVTTPDTWAAASDGPSITANGRQAKKVDTILSSFAAADAMARGLVARGKDPTWRAAPMLVYPERNTARWDEVLGLELGHRAGIENTAMKVGSQNAQEVTIEQIEWNIEYSTWSLTIAGSPCRDVWFIPGNAASLVGGTKVIGY